MSEREKEIEATVTGRVQGVNFRNFVKKWADELGLFGFARNLSDGSVEVVAQGKKEDLEQLVEKLHQGPYFAEVKAVEAEWYSTLQDSFTDFHIAETE